MTPRSRRLGVTAAEPMAKLEAYPAWVAAREAEDRKWEGMARALAVTDAAPFWDEVMDNAE
jgi:hypothetical protein